MFSKLDKYFFDVILAYKDRFEKTIKESLKYKLNFAKDTMETNKIIVTKNGKDSEYKIYVIGVYENADKKFKYLMPPVIFRTHLERQHFGDIIGKSGLDDKLFTDIVDIEYDYHQVIPYLISIYNPAFNLVRFISKDDKMIGYALVDLGIKQYFTQKDFDNFVLIGSLVYEKMNKNNTKNDKTLSARRGSNNSKNNKSKNDKTLSAHRGSNNSKNNKSKNGRKKKSRK